MTNRNCRGDGFLEGNGIIILILFFLMFGGGFGGWGNGANSSALQGSLTRAELYDGLNAVELKNGQERIVADICNTNTNMLNGFAGVQSSLCSGFAGVNANINQLGYNMQDCCCQIKTAIHSEGEETRALIRDNTIQNLRDKLADKDRELLATGLVTAQGIQTQNLESFIRSIMSTYNSCGGCNC